METTENQEDGKTKRQLLFHYPSKTDRAEEQKESEKV